MHSDSVWKKCGFTFLLKIPFEPVMKRTIERRNKKKEINIILHEHSHT
jgi:hypothetical protein